MPRKVPRETLDLWRRLDAEGKSYVEIGKETGWDPRTVSRYLKSEIRFSQPDSIRRELFKEGLRDHWKMVIIESVELLRAVQVVEPWVSLSEIPLRPPTEFNFGGATILIDQGGRVHG